MILCFLPEGKHHKFMVVSVEFGNDLVTYSN